MHRLRALLTLAAVFAARVAGAQEPVVIRAGMLIDGRGGVQRDAIVVVRGGRIERVVPGTTTGLTVTHDELDRFFLRKSKIGYTHTTPCYILQSLRTSLALTTGLSRFRDVSVSFERSADAIAMRFSISISVLPMLSSSSLDSRDASKAAIT